MRNSAQRYGSPAGILEGRVCEFRVGASVTPGNSDLGELDWGRNRSYRKDPAANDPPFEARVRRRPTSLSTQTRIGTDQVLVTWWPTEYLDTADDELRGLGEITSKSLGFIRVDTEVKDIDLVELAQSALHLHRVKISSKRINVETRSEVSVIASIKRGEIFQVLTNLLLNSIDALPHSGTLHVRVILRNKEAIITVADNGVGIPEVMRESLFNSFKSSKADGNGLGLWIVKEIIHNHRGRIQFRSSTLHGKSGTIFRVFLPIKKLAA
jgi:signal transduction histidine kinase